MKIWKGVYPKAEGAPHLGSRTHRAPLECTLLISHGCPPEKGRPAIGTEISTETEGWNSRIVSGCFGYRCCFYLYYIRLWILLVPEFYLLFCVAVSMTCKICWFVDTKDSLAQDRFGGFFQCCFEHSYLHIMLISDFENSQCQTFKISPLAELFVHGEAFFTIMVRFGFIPVRFITCVRSAVSNVVEQSICTLKVCQSKQVSMLQLQISIFSTMSFKCVQI